MSHLKTESDQEFGTHEAGQSPDMLAAKLWGNPCPFTFRVNYLALLYNTPLYSWIHDTYTLKRPEYVVLYSLALADGGSARDISQTSGFPKNTLSRAINQLERMDLINVRTKAPGSVDIDYVSLEFAIGTLSCHHTIVVPTEHMRPYPAPK